METCVPATCCCCCLHHYSIPPPPPSRYLQRVCSQILPTYLQNCHYLPPLYLYLLPLHYHYYHTTIHIIPFYYHTYYICIYFITIQLVHYLYHRSYCISNFWFYNLDTTYLITTHATGLPAHYTVLPGCLYYKTQTLLPFCRAYRFSLTHMPLPATAYLCRLPAGFCRRALPAFLPPAGAAAVPPTVCCGLVRTDGTRCGHACCRPNRCRSPDSSFCTPLLPFAGCRVFHCRRAPCFFVHACLRAWTSGCAFPYAVAVSSRGRRVPVPYRTCRKTRLLPHAHTADACSPTNICVRSAPVLRARFLPTTLFTNMLASLPGSG